MFKKRVKLVSRMAIFMTLLLVALFVLIRFLDPFQDDYWSVIFDFIGSFHPVILHLPIGLWFGVLALFVLHLFQRERVQESLVFGSALVTLVFAIFTFAAGFVLYLGGGYGSGSIAFHMYSSLAFLTALIAFVIGFGGGFGSLYCTLTAITTSAILLISGHAGGVITHGEPLDRAPWRVFAARQAKAEALALGKTGEGHVFADLVMPILNEKCIACHGTERAKGRLQMDSYIDLIKGGSKGLAYVPGDLSASLMITRMHLPLEHSERMPPAERPQLDAGELAFLEWWVTAGLPENQLVRDTMIPEEHALYVNSLIGNSEEAMQAQALKMRKNALMAAYAEIQAQFPGVLVQSIQNDAVFELSSSSMFGYNEEAVREALAPLAESVVRIDWNRRPLDASWIHLFAQSKSLQVLNLTDCDFSADALSVLLAKKNSLKKINLTGTAFSDRHIDHLIENSGIETIVLTDTDLSKSGFSRLISDLPGTQVISNFSL
ncbi:MAG: hypothetical protein CBC33_002025 [Coraliomargarita sp. TMED73]|nr:MAG: hypothetical protein CBC33_002025 [Coraliomargarita sp. TMED73]